eukprot:COSAG05_NODE_1713_length_4230_cov_3.216897_8_plen_108_part_00
MRLRLCGCLRYGDIVAETDIEKLWAVAAMLFGALVFAAITGSLASRMMATKGGVAFYNQKMDEVRQYHPLATSNKSCTQFDLFDWSFTYVAVSAHNFGTKEVIYWPE